MLGDVEPHQPERAVLAHPGEQVRDLPGLVGLGTHCDFGKQHRQAGKSPHFGNGLAEDAEEGLGRSVVVAVDPTQVTYCRQATRKRSDRYRARPPGGSIARSRC